MQASASPTFCVRRIQGRHKSYRIAANSNVIRFMYALPRSRVSREPHITDVDSERKRREKTTKLSWATSAKDSSSTEENND
jgi:hypothetical protein